MYAPCAVIFLYQIQDTTCGCPMHKMYKYMVKPGIEDNLVHALSKNLSRFLTTKACLSEKDFVFISTLLCHLEKKKTQYR